MVVYAHMHRVPMHRFARKPCTFMPCRINGRGAAWEEWPARAVLLALFFMIFPIVPMGFMMLMPLFSIALHVGFMFFIMHGVASIANSVGDMCADVAPDAEEKKVEAKQKPSSTETRNVGATSIKPEKDAVVINVEAPGVRSEDLTISARHNVITIKGESTRGTAVYRLEREVHVSPYEDVDVDSVTATHADGILTLVIQRKPSKSIPVVAAVPVPLVARQQAETKEPEEPSKKEEEDGWSEEDVVVG